MIRNVFQTLATAAEANQRVALALLAQVKGSSPQKAGALAVFFPDGRQTGTLGGGCLEAEAGQLAQQALATGAPQPFDILLDGGFRWDDGMICGGRVTGWVLPDAQAAGADYWRTLADTPSTISWGVTPTFEFIAGDAVRKAGEDLIYQAVAAPPISLWIAGAGHVSQAVAPLASSVGFAVSVFDDREALASREYFGSGIDLRSGPWEELIQLKPQGQTYGVVMTRGHEHDATILRTWLRRDFAYLGMIGSKRKARLMREAFVQEGVATAEQMDLVECPVGLAIGAISPAEIALSIVARLVEFRASRGSGESRS